MAIAYSSAGAGAGTETTSASLDLDCPAAVAANDILIAHVSWLDITSTPTDPSGWRRLYPPMPGVGAHLGTGTAVGRSWVYGKIADGTEDGATIGFGTAGGTAGRYGRIYSFTGYVSGDIEDVVPLASFTDTPTETSIPLPTVTTTQAGALAVALLTQDDNNAFAAAGAQTGGTWAEPVAEFSNNTIGAQGCSCAIQTSTPTGDPGTVSGGTANATADEGSTIGFEIRPEPADGPRVAVFASARDTSNPKSVVVADCGNGDKLYVTAGGNASGTNQVTAASVSTTAGSTGSWTEEQEQLSATTACWCGAYSVSVTGDGDVTVAVDRTQTNTQRPWTMQVWRVRTGSSTGAEFVPKHTSDSTEVINAVVADGSAVVVATYEWDGATAGTFTPSGAIEIERAIQPDTAYEGVVGLWVDQAAGTRDYGTDGSSGTQFRGELIEILAAVPGVEGTADGSFVFTGMAAGVPRTPGTAVGSFGFTGTALGQPFVSGTAAGSFGFTGTALGVVEGGATVEGSALGAFTFTGAAAGNPRKAGTAAATVTFTGTAAGKPTTFGTAAASFTFTGTALGTPDVQGVAAGSFGFTGTALGFAGTPPVTGTAAGVYTFTGAASGHPTTPGTGAASFAFTGAAQGVPRPLGQASGTVTFTGTVAGKRTVLGLTAAQFVFAGSALGTGATNNADSVATVTARRTSEELVSVSASSSSTITD